eukprot:1553877-Prorocentrum_lima.AAC.1
MEGTTRKLCERFATDQGCPLGRKCRYEHPRECPGTCVIGGSTEHYSRACPRPGASDGARPKSSPKSNA